MTTNNEKFLQIVEEAEKITQTISMLQKEITSYQTAGKSLEEVKTELSNYMVAAGKVSESLVELSNTVTVKLVDISSKADKLDEDLGRLAANTIEIEKGLEKRSQEVNKEIATLKDEVKNATQNVIIDLTKRADEINSHIKVTDKNIEEGLQIITEDMESIIGEKTFEINNKLHSIKIMIYIAIGVAFVSVIIGLLL